MSRQGQPIGYERVVLLADDDDVPIGTADKATVHHATTPRHRGFSCYVMDASHRVLVTRRSLTKRTWPGVWSNSFCGHPAPGEPYEHAVHRRAADELGLALFELRCVLPSFRYAATDLTGIVENEHCPVYVATTASIPVPDPDEVCELAWTTGDALLSLVQQTPWAITPWAALQVPLLAADLIATTVDCAPEAAPIAPSSMGQGNSDVPA